MGSTGPPPPFLHEKKRITNKENRKENLSLTLSEAFTTGPFFVVETEQSTHPMREVQERADIGEIDS